MEIIDYEMARSMLDAIPSLHDAIASFFNDHLGKSFPHAPAVAEIAAFPYPNITRNAYSQGAVLVDVAADHLMAFSKTLTEPVETFAPWVCVRTVLEASAIASWLLDPAVSSEERARRSFAFRFEGMTESLKFMRVSMTKQGEIDTLLKRIDEVEDDAVRCGFGPVRDKNRKRIGIGMQMPSVTVLVKQVFDDEPTYRLLSAVAHGHQWALLKLGYARLEEDEGKSDYVKMAKRISPDSVGYLSARTVRAFVLPVWYKSRQNGWDMERLRRILESSYDDIKISENVRFWRTDVGASSTTPDSRL